MKSPPSCHAIARSLSSPEFELHLQGPSSGRQTGGSRAGVRCVLEGTVRRGSARVRVLAQLIDVGTGNHIWAERYDRPLEDVFVVQDEIARAVVGLHPAVAEAEQRRTLRKPTESLSAGLTAMFVVAPLGSFPSNTNISATACARRAGRVDAALSPDRAEPTWRPLCVVQAACGTFGWCQIISTGCDRDRTRVKYRPVANPTRASTGSQIPEKGTADERLTCGHGAAAGGQQHGVRRDRHRRRHFRHVHALPPARTGHDRARLRGRHRTSAAPGTGTAIPARASIRKAGPTAIPSPRN